MVRCALVVGLFVCLAGRAYSHALMTQPRCRGSLNTQRDIPNRVIDPSAIIDYCPHCQNCGGTGTVAQGGPWEMFKPMESQRKGITLCGDPTGNDDHMRSGMFANPLSTPYVANYEPGSIANFEYDVTAHHNGFLEFYLCDVADTGDVVNTVEFFTKNCRYLERSPHPDCEAGTDKMCGPIDPKFPGRWVLPCKDGSSDQVFGGDSGKMAYKIPSDFQSNDAVVINYWLTANSCNDPDGFMDDYAYPAAWGTCPGDGGSVGGRPSFPSCIDVGRVPEEFFNCADVQVGGDGQAPAPIVPVNPPGNDVTKTDAPVTTTADEDATTTPDAVTTTPAITTADSVTTTSDAATTTADNATTTEEDDPATSAPVTTEGTDDTDDTDETDAGASTTEPGTTAPTIYDEPTATVKPGCKVPEPGVVPDPMKPGTPAEASDPEGKCSLRYKQCGGKNWDGPTECCDGRFSCVKLSEYYFQCLTVPNRPKQYGSYSG